MDLGKCRIQSKKAVAPADVGVTSPGLLVFGGEHCGGEEI
jgi:hypothetical protein